MDSKRIALLTVAVCAIGIFALPGTVSLFSGQHSWYGLDSEGNDVPCEKCHGDIADEMISDGSDGNGVHRNLTCAMCHRTCFKVSYNPSTGQYESVAGYVYGSGNGLGSEPGKDAHGAATIECMDCHAVNEKDFFGGYPYDHEHYAEYYGDGTDAYCHKCHISGTTTGQDAFILAGGFGLTGRPAFYNDTGERAAHRDFVNDSIDDPLMEGANEACIACHTRIGVNISWTKSTTLHFNANETHDGTWLIDDFTAHGQNKTFSTYKNNWTNSY